MSASERVLALPSALLLLLAQAFPSVLASAIRFRSLLELKVAAPFPSRPALKILAQRMGLKSPWAPPHWPSDLSAARSSAPLNQTKLSASGALRAATLQRISPAINATWASAISVTFRQKRGVFDIYFDSALVAMPTLVICACFSASINAINFCTGKSRSGRITTAMSGLVCFNSVSRAVSAFKSIT